MSESDDFAEAHALLPHEDPDKLYDAARSAWIQWARKLDPFVGVSFRRIEIDMERIGRVLTDHVDRDAREAEMSLPNSAYRRRAEIMAMFLWHQDQADHVASGW